MLIVKRNFAGSSTGMSLGLISVGALELCERGQLKLDEPVATYLPQLAKPQVALLKAGDSAPAYDSVAPVRAPNVIDLMRHTSGWAYGGRGATAVHKMYPAGSAAVAVQFTGAEFVDKLGRKTVEYMTSNQLTPGVFSTIAETGDPTRADCGFGLGVAVRTTPGIARLTGSVGDYSWSGAFGTTWWVDPKEQLSVVFMAQTPGPLRWHYRHLLSALVNAAIID